MTHFYIELTNDGKFSDVEPVQKLFSKKFPENSHVQEKDIRLNVADFIENNYEISNSKSKLEIQISKNKYPVLSTENTDEENYSPLFVYDKKQNELVIKTDPFGTEYVYLAFIDDNKIAISSHLKYILKINTSLLDKLDYNAILEYLFSHSVFGTKTLFKDIKLLPSNSIVTIKDWKTNLKKVVLNSIKKKKERYQFPKNYKEDIDLETAAAGIANDLQNLFTKYSEEDYGKLAFLLTGGLDSRTLISSVPTKYKDKIEAYTFDCHNEGREIRNAREITELLDIKHNTVTINENDILENCFKHLWYSEGVSNHIIGIRLKLYKEMPEKVMIIDGFLGDGQFGGNYSTGIKKFTRRTTSTAKNILDKLIAQELAFPKRVFSKICKIDKENINKILLKGLEEQIKQNWQIDNKELQLECLVTQIRARGYMIGSVRSVNYISEIVTPYAHPEIMSKYLEVNHKLRAGRNFELFTLSKINQELVAHHTTSLIWYNRMASTIFVQLGFRFLKALETMTRKRIVPKYSAVPFFEWIRNKGRYYDFLNDILQDENCIIWNFLKQEETYQFFDNFVKRKNHLHKFLIHIIDLELILRMFYSLRDTNENICFIDSKNKKVKCHIKVSKKFKDEITEIVTSDFSDK